MEKKTTIHAEEIEDENAGSVIEENRLQEAIRIVKNRKVPGETGTAHEANKTRRKKNRTNKLCD